MWPGGPRSPAVITTRTVTICLKATNDANRLPAMSISRVDRIIRWDEGQTRADSDELAEEEPLEIRVRGRSVSITMRTPGNDSELAAGFLLTEGVIHRANDILRIQNCQRNEFGNVINVQLAPDVTIDFDRLTRHVFASSSCGLCGKATIEAVQSEFAPLANGAQPQIEARILSMLPEKMERAQAVFNRTGCLHAAALFDERGDILILHEDVGRHNAVDKVLGTALLRGWPPLERHGLLVSGRTSFEIVQKALAARVPMIAAVSAPTSLAVSFAAAARQTLIGFLRGGRMNIYCGAERVGNIG